LHENKKNLVLIVIMARYLKTGSNTKYPTGKKDESLRLVQDSGPKRMQLMMGKLK
jgi:hypothetical protein